MILFIMFHVCSLVIHFVLKGMELNNPSKGLLKALTILYIALALSVVVSLLIFAPSSNLAGPMGLSVGFVFGWVLGELQDVGKKVKG